ncbi:MAG: NAD(P)-binding domain-containing protein [Proteobacteria bacterium]|nr:NAD(P)-binding domain-containing protein [Pseudomonadota bacterium]
MTAVLEPHSGPFCVLGSGVVGQVLSDGFLKHGYQVMRGSRDPSKLAAWCEAAGPAAAVGTFAQAAAFSDTLVLAVKGSAAEAALGLCGLSNLAGKTILDATNPIADAPPVNGLLRFFTGPHESLLERLQAQAPQARLVKAFSCVGSARMVNPDFAGSLPTMFICGNDEAAKARVRGILTLFGWETEDLGVAAAARAIEPLCILWCLPGFLRNQWTHAFKLLK